MGIYDWDFGYDRGFGSIAARILGPRYWGDWISVQHYSPPLSKDEALRFMTNGSYVQAGVAISDSGESKTLTIDCPGIAKADLALEVAPKSEGEAVVRVKGKTGNRSIDVSVPVWNVNVSEVKASYSDGVLTITLPKSAPKAKSVLVPIG